MRRTYSFTIGDGTFQLDLARVVAISRRERQTGILLDTGVWEFVFQDDEEARTLGMAWSNWINREAAVPAVPPSPAPERLSKGGR